MALSASLEAEFGQGGFSLTDIFAGLTTELTGIEAPDVPLDGASLSATTDQLGSIDASAMGDAIGLVVSALEALGVDLPLVDDLVAPMTAVLEAADQLIAIDIAESRDALLGQVTGIDGVGLDALGARLSNLEATMASEQVRTLTDIVSSLIPGGFDVGSVLGAFADDLRGFEMLLRSLGALMGVAMASREIAEGARSVLGMMDPGELDGISLALGRWTDHDLAGLLEGIDPTDPRLVEIIAEPILSMARDVRMAAEGLTRGFGFGHATLVGIDLLGLSGRLDAASALVTEHGLDAVRALAERIVALAQPVLTMQLPDPENSIEALLATIQGHLSTVAGAIDSLDPADLTAGLTTGFTAALSYIDGLAKAAEEMVVIARGAFETVKLAIAAIDLGPITDAINDALEPVTAVIDEITAVVGSAQATIEDASAVVVAAMDTVRVSFEDAAGAIATAFDRVDAFITALDLGNLQANIEVAIEPITGAVASLNVLPVFDTAVDVIDTAATVIGAVPLGLLPDDALEELAEAVRPVKAIDFQVDVADVLNARLDEIVAFLDTDLLGAIEEAYAAVIEFLDSIDPATPLEEIESEVFDPFLEELRAINPTELLAPLEEALVPFQDAIGGFDLGEELLQPIESAIDDIAARMAEFNPAAMLAPIESQVDDARTSITELLKLDDIKGHLDATETLITEALSRVDPDRILEVLDAASAPLTEELLSSRSDANVAGTALALLMQGTGMRVRGDSFDVVGGWIGGTPAGSLVQGLLSDAADSLESLLAATDSFDLSTIVTDLQPRYRSLQAGIDALPTDSPLRLAIEIEVAGASPLELLGPFVDAVSEYRNVLETAATELRRLAASERSGLDAVASGLRDALRPLLSITDWLRSIAGRFGLDATSSPREIVRAFAASFTPSTVLAPVIDAIKALIAKVEAMAVIGVLSPIREAINDVEAALAAIDIGFVVDELDAIHTEVVTSLDQIRPSVVLSDVLASFEALQTTLSSFDPLEPVRVAVDAMTDAVEDAAEQLRPTVVFEPVATIYQRVVNALGALNVRALLDPLLAAIERITLELGTGLDMTAVALGRLQDSLPDPDSLGGGSAGASAGVSVGIG